MISPVFMSASVPDPKRNTKYWETADNVAIREAVRALAELFSKRGQLVYGGHPAITPLVSYVVDKLSTGDKKRIHIYQSQWFSKEFPIENSVFERLTIIPSESTREDSLIKMREEMLAAYPYKAAVFIGGMEGIEEEYRLFRHMHPKAKVFPVATTGAASRILYNQRELEYERELETNYGYGSLFRSLLQI